MDRLVAEGQRCDAMTPQCTHMTAEMAANCPTCNPSALRGLPTMTPQEAAKVLEWQNDEHLLVENATSTALTPFGRYYATASSFWGPGTIISTGYTSEEMAQAQAQKDYSFRLSRAISEDSHE